MTTKQTPRTSAAILLCGKEIPQELWFGYMCDHSRKIERELTEAKERIEELKDMIDDAEKRE